MIGKQTRKSSSGGGVGCWDSQLVFAGFVASRAPAHRNRDWISVWSYLFLTVMLQQLLSRA